MIKPNFYWKKLGNSSGIIMIIIPFLRTYRNINTIFEEPTNRMGLAMGYIMGILGHNIPCTKYMGITHTGINDLSGGVSINHFVIMKKFIASSMGAKQWIHHDWVVAYLNIITNHVTLAGHKGGFSWAMTKGPSRVAPNTLWSSGLILGGCNFDP